MIVEMYGMYTTDEINGSSDLTQINVWNRIRMGFNCLYCPRFCTLSLSSFSQQIKTMSTSGI